MRNDLTGMSASPADHRTRSTGSLPVPGAIGRGVRLLTGGLLLSWFLTMVTQGTGLLSRATPPTHWTFWLYVVITWLLTPHVVNIGFGRDWGRGTHLLVVAGAALSILANLLLFGRWWGPFPGGFLWLWSTYISGHLGAAFILSGMLATPGCELRSPHHLYGLIRGRSFKQYICPGPLDRLDAWEASRSAGEPPS